MPSRRDQIRMTDEEIRRYLRSQPRLILVSNGPGGFPHPMPMNFGLDDQDRVIVSTFAKSQKVKNFERDPRAALLAESGLAYEELKSVVIYARTEIIRDPEAVREAMGWMAAKQQTRVAESPEKQAQLRQTMAKRVVLRFTPERVISWDHGKLGGKY